MITFISRRLFLISTISLVLFIVFTAFSFAQQPASNSEPTTTQIVRPMQNDRLNRNVAERVAERKTAIEEQREENKAELTERLSNIENTAKSAALERINSAIESLNENKTDKWASILDTLSGVLERIKAKLETLESEGADVSDITALVTSAETAIEEASSVVETQAEKTYTFEITDERTLRGVVQPVIQTFRQDLNSTLTAVKSARDAVREAAIGLSQINMPTNNEEASDSAIIEQ